MTQTRYMYTSTHTGYSARPSYGWASHVVVWGMSVLAAATVAAIPKGPGECVCIRVCMHERGRGVSTQELCFLFLKRSVQGLFHKQYQLKFCKLRHYETLVGSDLLLFCKLLPNQNFGNYISCFYSIRVTRLVIHPVCTLCEENYR